MLSAHEECCCGGEKDRGMCIDGAGLFNGSGTQCIDALTLEEYAASAFSRPKWKEQWWDSNYCQTSTASQEYCGIIFQTSAENALGLPGADATAYDQTFPLNTDPKAIFGDCTISAGAGCVTSTLREDKAYCSTADLTKDLVTSRTNCLAKKLGTNGCMYLPGKGTVGVNLPLIGEACVPATDCNAAVGLLGTCLQCVKHCRESLIADMRLTCTRSPSPRSSYWTIVVVVAVIVVVICGVIFITVLKMGMMPTGDLVPTAPECMCALISHFPPISCLRLYCAAYHALINGDKCADAGVI
jgi:hypothetical protein